MSERDASAHEPRLLTIPNLLTFLRLLLVPVFVIASLRGLFMLAFVSFVTAGITDIVDGYIARKLNQQSRLGALLDPAVDKMMMASGYLLYTLLQRAEVRLPLSLTFAVFARDVVIVLFAYLLFTRVRIRRFPPSWQGKTSTVFQVVALSVTIAANTFMQPLAVPLLEIVWPATFAMTLYSGFDYLRKWNDVLLEDETPVSEPLNAER